MIVKFGRMQVLLNQDDCNEGFLDYMLNDFVMIVEVDSFFDWWEDLDFERFIWYFIFVWWKGMRMVVLYVVKVFFEIFGNVVEMREMFLQWDEFVVVELGELYEDCCVIF